MIVSLNTGMSVKSNSPKIAKNNTPNVAFKRNFTTQEVEALVNKKTSIVNSVITFISAGVIRAQDGADKVAKSLLQKHPDNLGIQLVAAKFP